MNSLKSLVMDCGPLFEMIRGRANLFTSALRKRPFVQRRFGRLTRR